ncbi:unnamed protein product [Cochlearia groenlandica]
MSTLTPSLTVISFLCLILTNLSFVSSNSSTNIKEGEIRLPSEKINKPVSCPVKCFRADPVCGEDGVTYWCGCTDAMCNGVGVLKTGACDVIGNGVGLSFQGQALLLIHIVWLMALGFSILFGLF